MASFGLTVIRGIFRAADHVAPRIAGRIAFELFCRTADPAKPSAGEKCAIETAAGFMEEARHHRLTVGSDCVAAHEFRPLSGRWSRRSSGIPLAARSRSMRRSARWRVFRRSAPTGSCCSRRRVRCR